MLSEAELRQLTNYLKNCPTHTSSDNVNRGPQIRPSPLMALIDQSVMLRQNRCCCSVWVNPYCEQRHIL